MISPYSKNVAKLIEQRLFNQNIKLMSNIPFNIKTRFENVVYEKEFVKIINNNHQTDLIIISCTNLRSLDLIKKFENQLNIPIISSNQALFWLLLKKVSLNTNHLCPYGQIFKH